MKPLLAILAALLLVGCKSPQPLDATLPVGASPTGDGHSGPKKAQHRTATVVAPAPVTTNFITVSWIARGASNSVLSNVPTRILWTDSLRTNFIPLATNSTGRQGFKGTNHLGFFRLEALP